MSKPSNSFNFNRTGIITRNRTVLAAMTNKQSHENGILSDSEINWLIRRAKGGFGIITTAATHVSKDGQAWDGEFGVFDDIHVDKLTTLATLIHNHGALIFAQLFHGGSQASQKLTGEVPLSSSRISSKGSKNGFAREASNKEIERIIDDFTSAAVRCSDAGFDGVELHGAHGYLISQFLGSKTNTRSDKWGGDLEKRSRFLVEIFNSIKKNVPDSFMIGIRISPELKSLGICLEDSLKLGQNLSDLGIDYLHISCWDVFKRSQTYPEDPRTLTEWFADYKDKLAPIISTGKVWSTKDAQALMLQGADLIGVARVGIGYPDWPKGMYDLSYNPQIPPFTTAQLKEAQLGDKFINYMRNWEGFVVD